MRLRAWDAGKIRALGLATIGWLAPFALVLYLALKNGGYDVTVRGEVGLAIWWVILIGALSGFLIIERIRRAAWILIGGLAVLALWTGLGIAWSESAERSLIELARVITFLGVFVLGASLQGREGLRRTIAGVGSAIAVVGALALVSRLEPSWIPAGELQRIADARVTRLNYPLNYWNGLAALMAIGIPLATTLALRSRSLLGQALCAASVPVMATTAFFTLSRGGAIEIAVGLATMVAIYPRRLSALPTLAITGIGSATLIAAATQRDALEAGLVNEAARRQGDEMLGIVLAVATAVALLQVAIALTKRYSIVPQLRVPPRITGGVAAAGVVVAVAIGVAAGVPDRLDREWQEFKNPVGIAAQGAARFESSSGLGRYQLWESAIDANDTARVSGIGPGTFEFWWAENGTEPIFVRDAHSLYLETLAELGIIGFVIIVGLVGGVIVLGLNRVRRASEDKRSLLAGAVGACTAFAIAAGIDWVWEMAVFPTAFFLLAAAIAGPAVVRERGRRREQRNAGEASVERGSWGSGRAPRLAVAAIAGAALIAIAIPYTGASFVAESQDVDTEVPDALDRARQARDVQPYAASPTLQEAALLESIGDLAAAADVAREATRQDSTNWRTWMLLARIETRRGHAPEAVDAYRMARSLNPRSPLFAK